MVELRVWSRFSNFEKKESDNLFFTKKHLFLVTSENCALNIRVRSLSKAQINYVVKNVIWFSY